EPNVKIVVGSQAAAMDVASAADIAVALGSLLYTEKEVEASGVSVVVKKDVTYDPEDLVIYKYFYNASGRITTITATKWDELPSDYWWNGSAYNGSYDEWVAAYKTKPWSDEIEDIDAINGDYQIDWDLSIDEIHLNPTSPSGWDESDIAQPPKDAKLSIPAGAFKVILNYTISNWSVTVDLGKDDQWGIPSSKSFNVIDDDRPDKGAIADEYGVDPSDVTITFEKYVYNGTKKGDTITVLGKEYYILEVLSDGIKYGHDHGQVWFHIGDVKEFDGYKIKAVDISISPSNKALFEVTAPDGRSDLIIISTDEGNVDISDKSDKFEPGEVVLNLVDTFIGIDENLIAQLEVRTNVVEVHSGEQLVSGWKVNFHIEDDKVKWITLTNKDDLKGSKLDILGKYIMCYKIESHTLTKDDTTYYAAKAYIVVKPSEPIIKTKELKVGDELEGWTIEEIKG
ncbi:TPA: S-layer protein, partial [Candidatus Micrarchaeota archaeon]|nr:S-layer protein [Candidatus Micrarchaeota archaeon]